jgi:radical SAM protein with 4Fe4S-binding SPASM domain
MKKVQIDSHKLMYHPERVAEWKKTGDCFPIYVEIGPTNRCNHRCMFCALDWLVHGGADIDSDVLCKNLEDMAKNGVKSVMFAGEGEPLLHKDIAILVKTAKDSGIDVSMTTNGVLLNREKAEKILPCLSWIRFSIDAGTRETYAKIHGTRKEDFGRVMDAIKYAAEIKKMGRYPVTIGVQALLTSKSIDELEILTTIAKEVGADNIQIKPYSHHPASKNDLSFDFSQAEKMRPKLESLGDNQFQVAYRTNTIRRLNEERSYGECHGLPFFSLIDARGNVIPCNLFYNNPEFTYGNINEQLFSEIWKGERRKGILGKLKECGIEECRKGCRLDPINRYLKDVKSDKIKLKKHKGEMPPHVNFI